MATFKQNLHLGTKDPLIQTDDLADRSVTLRKLHSEVAKRVCYVAEITDNNDGTGIMEDVYGNFWDLTKHVDKADTPTFTVTDNSEEGYDNTIYEIVIACTTSDANIWYKIEEVSQDGNDVVTPGSFEQYSSAVTFKGDSITSKYYKVTAYAIIGTDETKKSDNATSGVFEACKKVKSTTYDTATVSLSYSKVAVTGGTATPTVSFRQTSIVTYTDDSKKSDTATTGYTEAAYAVKTDTTLSYNAVVDTSTGAISGCAATTEYAERTVGTITFSCKDLQGKTVTAEATVKQIGKTAGYYYGLTATENATAPTTASAIENTSDTSVFDRRGTFTSGATISSSGRTSAFNTAFIAIPTGKTLTVWNVDSSEYQTSSYIKRTIDSVYDLYLCTTGTYGQLKLTIS